MNARPCLTVPMLLALAGIASCTQPQPPAADTHAAAFHAASGAVTQDVAVPVASGLPTLVVHKTPTCGCCHQWVAHMQQAGFTVQTHDHDDLAGIKTEHGVPRDKQSCHTALVDGYVIEGHVPADDVKRLLAERPDIRGLTVPGMPAGSPGMEMPDGRVDAYAVEAIGKDGGTTVFARHRQ